jgi:hypothetical protein
MTVKAFITFDQVGQEHPFENNQERSAALEFVKIVWRHWHDSDKFVAVVANLQQPPADLIVMTDSGLGVVELKDYGGLIQGNAEKIWSVTTPSGLTRDVVAGNKGKHINPFKQVETYRRELYALLDEGVLHRPAMLPGWLTDEKTHLQATVCFTREIEKMDWSGVHVNLPWFTITRLEQETIAHWVYSLAFGEQHRLSERQIIHIIKDVLQAQSWMEAEHIAMDAGSPYGYLLVRNGDLQGLRLTLDHENMQLGRDPECGALCLPDNYTCVSRRHASIRRDGACVVLTDGHHGERSRNGTFSDGRNTKETYLSEGKTIILGAKALSSEDVEKGRACVLEYHDLRGRSAPPGTTVPRRSRHVK